MPDFLISLAICILSKIRLGFRVGIGFRIGIGIGIGIVLVNVGYLDIATA
jgi:hypothetical protein